MEKRHLIAATIIAIFILGCALYSYSHSLAGAVTRTPSAEGIVCCTFFVEGVEKTCVAPESKDCGICNEVCAQH
jgi:hypothetical protein